MIVELRKKIMIEQKNILTSFRNQDWKKVKAETDQRAKLVCS